VISERYERKSTIITSNLDVPEWPESFPNRILGAATVDRLRHGAYKVVLEAEQSYRLAQSAQQKQKYLCQKEQKMNSQKEVKMTV
jgi:DNA replication protein DnaC